MTSVQQVMVAKATIAGMLVMTPKSVTFRRHDYLVSVLFEDLLSHFYNNTVSMFLYLVAVVFDGIKINTCYVLEEQLGGLSKLFVEQLASL